MGLIQKLKSALGLDGAQSPEPGTTAPRDVDVTVEREPSSESEDAVKGTETAASGTETSGEADADVAGAGESITDESPIEEAEPDVEDATGDEIEETEPAETTDEPAEEAAEEAEPDAAEEAADVSDDPVTEISGIGPAYGERLSDAGVETVADLAAADPDELEAATDISASRIEGWIDAAAEY